LRLGILGFSDLLAGDPQRFFARMQIPRPWPSVNKVQLAVSATQSCDYLIEASLDVEWAGAVAPGSALTYLEGESSEAGFLEELNYFLNTPSTAQVVSSSYGWREDDLPREFIEALSNAVTQLAAVGIPFIAAGGECHDGPCVGVPPTGIPGALPDAISVGGTSLTSLAGVRVGEESAWTSTFAGRGQFCSCWNNTVALHADGGYAAVVDGVNLDGFGGTSFGAPIWTALYSTAADWLGHALPPSRAPLERIASARPSAFVDVRTGCSGTVCAAEGLDDVAGLGVPNGRELFAGASTLFGS
jgi:subtilase family serine protease